MTRNGSSKSPCKKDLAYSALGQVYVNQTFNVQAVNAFRQAAPLLKSNPTSYARNQYRLGFTLAKMQKIPEARAALTEAASIDSPYRALAQQTLAKIGGGARHRQEKTVTQGYPACSERVKGASKGRRAFHQTKQSNRNRAVRKRSSNSQENS